MADALEKLIGDDKDKKVEAPSGTPDKKEGEPPKPPEKTPEELKREEHLANLEKAITEGNDELKRIRKEKQALKTGQPVAEELPKIDPDDPSAKAWKNEIKTAVSPAMDQLEKGKEEVRSFALREFLKDRPALASNPEKVKELMGVYEKIRTASETTREGVLLDLGRAYGAVYHEEVLGADRQRRLDGARADSAFADPAVDQGAAGYRNSPDRPKRPLTQEERDIIAKWGMTEEEWQAMAKEHVS